MEYNNHVTRGDYDYCRVPGTRQLSPFEVGDDNSKLKHKNWEKVKSINTVKQKVVLGVTRHAESKSGLYKELTLLLQRFLATFLSKEFLFPEWRLSGHSLNWTHELLCFMSVPDNCKWSVQRPMRILQLSCFSPSYFCSDWEKRMFFTVYLQ